MGTRPSDISYAERYDEIKGLRGRITAGEDYIARASAAGRPVDRSTAYLAGLRARLAQLEQRFLEGVTSPAPSHPSYPVPSVPGAVPPRNWGTRHCPGCGTAHAGPWQANTEIWCGLCHAQHLKAKDALAAR